MRQIALLLAAALLAGCGSSASESECLDIPAMPMNNADAIFEFVSCQTYIDWPAENQRNPTTAPHGSETRVYINGSLETSLAAGNTEHPVGAASVKEIFTNSELSGWAYMVKVEAGTAPNSWYWYEVLSTAPGTAPVVSEAGASICVGCHESGSDYFRTQFPLR